MKKLNELKQERADLIVKMEELVANDTLTKEQDTQYESFNDEVSKLDKQITRMERQEELNKQTASFENVDNEDEKGISFSIALRDFLRTGEPSKEFASPRGGFMIPAEVLQSESFGALATTTDANVINKQVLADIQIAKSPAEQLVADLGVKVYTGLSGKFIVPSMAQLSSTAPGEGTTTVDASATITSLSLDPVRIGAYNEFNRELLEQTNPQIYGQIVQDLKDSIWRQVVYLMFDNIATDAAASEVNILATESAIDYSHLVDLQANVPYDLESARYVTTPKVAAYLKKTVVLSNVKGPIWEGPVMKGFIDGIPAYASAAVNDQEVHYGDFSKVAIGQWGGIELLVNPYIKDKEGQLRVTAHGMFDSGVANYRFFSWNGDASLA